MNTIGSYYCTCPDGYELDSSQTQCQGLSLCCFNKETRVNDIKLNHGMTEVSLANYWSIAVLYASEGILPMN